MKVRVNWRRFSITVSKLVATSLKLNPNGHTCKSGKEFDNIMNEDAKHGMAIARALEKRSKN